MVDCIDKPLTMYCDNQPTVFDAHNNKSINATKPIDIKYYVVKDKIQNHTISLEHITTKDMLTDPLTKSLRIQDHTYVVTIVYSIFIFRTLALHASFLFLHNSIGFFLGNFV